MRALGPAISLLFAFCFLAPVVVHHQEARRLSWPPAHEPLPQVIEVALTHAVSSKGSPATVELDLGPPPDTREPESVNLPPIELIRGAHVSLTFWLRARTLRPPLWPLACALRPLPGMRASVVSLASLCVPVSRLDLDLEPTGRQRAALQHGDGEPGDITPGFCEFEYVAAVEVPGGWYSTGHWMVVLHRRALATASCCWWGPLWPWTNTPSTRSP
ncbi:hypothetical protein T492DRAFT_539297 [Pavlovales sp. CCMP2436]|nr:hypothetical protein T492DRAFT_539297 [Pavlovales sp. CCMP2436]|mmetsp:Transcript_5150/g.12801  ORF Transcript_5150/g.12801 Transcript_5150/m.12801 type:complete len:216 (+) Transcript_5150:632-1279(+)